MTDLAYDIVRSDKRRKLTITVERNRAVIVHAPASASEADIARLVNGKRQWIMAKLQHPQKYRSRRHPPGKEVVNGEAAPISGATIGSRSLRPPVAKLSSTRSSVSPPKQQTNRRRVLRDWYVARAKEKILARAVNHAKDLGVGFDSARIVDNRYRWGSCTVKNNVNFNWRLIKAPLFVIDYVIVHELAHLLEANHTDRFWSIIRAHIPAMVKAKSWLKEHGQILEEEV